MRRFLAAGLGILLGLAAVWAGEGRGLSPGTRPATQPSSAIGGKAQDRPPASQPSSSPAARPTTQAGTAAVATSPILVDKAAGPGTDRAFTPAQWKALLQGSADKPMSIWIETEPGKRASSTTLVLTPKEVLACLDVLVAASPKAMMATDGEVWYLLGKVSVETGKAPASIISAMKMMHLAVPAKINLALNSGSGQALICRASSPLCYLPAPEGK